MTQKCAVTAGLVRPDWDDPNIEVRIQAMLWVVELKLYWNPLTFVIEQSRNVLIWGTLPDFGGLLVYSAVSLGVAWLGLLAFKAMRSGFADVL